MNAKHAIVGRGSLAAVLLAAAVAIPGCGGDAAEPSGDTVNLRITRDFGRDLLMAEDRAELPERPTVMRLLRQHETIGTGFGGAVIESVDGREHSMSGSRHTRWILYINGIRSTGVPIGYRLHPGDHVQLDLREWNGELTVRASVGAFPLTFTRRTFGNRPPLTIACEDHVSPACRRVKRKLRAAGASARDAMADEIPPRGRNQAQIVVGKWSHWRDRRLIDTLGDGPEESNVFARFTPDGRRLQLLDPSADHVRTAGAGTGLIGAIKTLPEPLIWVVTGVDDEGVDRASRALDPRDLLDAYAVAITDRGVEKLPLPSTR